MKKILISMTIMMLTTAAQAGGIVLLSEKTVPLTVDISTTKVKLSVADYSSPVVKVLVPDLADVTVLDHRNTGEGAPCMATYDTLEPMDVIQDNPSIEEIPMTIKLEKIVSEDFSNNVCHVTLSETITSNIRGFEFNHYKSHYIGTRHIDDCK